MDRRQFLTLSAEAPSTAPESTLASDGDWTRRRAAHLTRRTGFGAKKNHVDALLAEPNAAAAANRLVDKAASEPLPQRPDWYDHADAGDEIDHLYQTQRRWFDAMRRGGRRSAPGSCFHEKMALFWHNHFAVQYGTLRAQTPDDSFDLPNLSSARLAYDYLTLLRRNAFSNFKTFLRRMSTNPAMLIYLDGYSNVGGQANENYAREVMELFTMGQYGPQGDKNYTEQDMKELARALTGFYVTSNYTAAFDRDRHDLGKKTFLGRTLSFELSASDPFSYVIRQIVDVLFEERGPQIARFICRKLYCFFVQPMPNEAVVKDLADTFLKNDFELKPLLKKLLASAHFYHDSFIAARIKSPIELLAGFFREIELTPPRDELEDVREVLRPVRLGQELFNPPNVAGWPGFNPPDSTGTPGPQNWISTNKLPERWKLLSKYLGRQAYDPLEMARQISDRSNPFAISVDFAETLLPIPLAEAGLPDLSDQEWGGDPNSQPAANQFDADYEKDLAKLLLNGLPWYDWPFFTSEDDEPDRAPTARRLLRQYLIYLAQLPAYQLM